MQQLDKNKVRHLSKFSQLILLNVEAHIVSSCNSIFPTHELLDLPVTSWFPFLESIFDYLFQLQTNSSEVKFSKIETPIKQLPGIYDFTFSKVIIDQEDLLLWSIYDYTDLYEDFKHYQQRRNEFEILRETLERRYKNLKSKDDIILGQNIILENFNHFQLNYYNKVKSALQSPVNALDGMTFILSNKINKGDVDYLEALEASIIDIQQIIEELQQLRKWGVEQSRFHSKSSIIYPRKVLNDVVILFRESLDIPVEIAFDIKKEVPEALKGNNIYLGQILFGLLTNIFQYHPLSRLKISLSLIKIDILNARLLLQITEFLGREALILQEEDISILTLRLSVVKQLIDLQKGTISVEKDAKSLGITVTCELEYALNM